MHLQYRVTNSVLGWISLHHYLQIFAASCVSCTLPYTY